MEETVIRVPALEFKEVEDGWIEAQVRLPSTQTGYYEDSVGGPTIATLVDLSVVEVIRAQEGVDGPTYALSYHIRKRVPVNTEIIVRAKATRRRHTVYHAKVEIRDLAGILLAHGKGSLKVAKTSSEETEYIILRNPHKGDSC